MQVAGLFISPQPLGANNTYLVSSPRLVLYNSPAPTNPSPVLAVTGGDTTLPSRARCAQSAVPGEEEEGEPNNTDRDL